MPTRFGHVPEIVTFVISKGSVLIATFASDLFWLLSSDNVFVEFSLYSVATVMSSFLDQGISKLYYTISEVAAMVDEEAHVLRYWETEFKQLRPKKNKSGKRIYTRSDIDIVFRIRNLLREDKFTLEGARQALSSKTTATVAEGGDAKDLVQVRALLTQMLDRIRTD
jgi:DNA-binding transcriptional MerR regulator